MRAVATPVCMSYTALTHGAQCPLTLPASRSTCCLVCLGFLYHLLNPVLYVYGRVLEGKETQVIWRAFFGKRVAPLEHLLWQAKTYGKRKFMVS